MILSSPTIMSDNTIDNSIDQLQEITTQQQNTINSIQATLVIQQNDIDNIKTTIVDIRTSINRMIHCVSEIATKLGFEITLPPPLPIPRTPPTSPSIAVAAAPSQFFAVAAAVPSLSLYTTVADSTTAAPSSPKSLTPLPPYPAYPTLLPTTVAGSTTSAPPSSESPAASAFAAPSRSRPFTQLTFPKSMSKTNTNSSLPSWSFRQTSSAHSLTSLLDSSDYPSLTSFQVFDLYKNDLTSVFALDIVDLPNHHLVKLNTTTAYLQILSETKPLVFNPGGKIDSECLLWCGCMVMLNSIIIQTQLLRHSCRQLPTLRTRSISRGW